jgi:hypothetical protein
MEDVAVLFYANMHIAVPILEEIFAVESPNTQQNKSRRLL